MQVKNVKVAFLEESVIRSGYPMQVGEPDDIISTTQDTAADNKRAFKLANTPNGSGHNNFLKGIIVQFDLQYPEYFSPQLQRYHWIDIVSSQSKMHRITSRELTSDDFTNETSEYSIEQINNLIENYKLAESNELKDRYFNRIISNLPSGYLKWMGISTNYLQLKTIYSQRKTHKLGEWQEFCKWIEALPMSELITGKNK